MICHPLASYSSLPFSLVSLNPLHSVHHLPSPLHCSSSSYIPLLCVRVRVVFILPSSITQCRSESLNLRLFPILPTCLPKLIHCTYSFHAPRAPYLSLVSPRILYSECIHSMSSNAGRQTIHGHHALALPSSQVHPLQSHRYLV